MIGTVISHYRILEKLGEGGMGVVYKAEDLQLTRPVALKFLPQRLAATDDERQRLLREARAASALNHPNVCGIHAICEEEGQTFIDMEFVEGRTLRARIGDGPLGTDDAIEYAIQIGDALQEAHGKGIVHRDVKPENIMINGRNQVKVMDFGLAKLKGSLKLTRSSSTVGTMAYMAPEQIERGEADARADIFSFGIVLFEMLTGHTPFRGDHEAAMMYSILNEEPQSLPQVRTDCPAELDRIIHRALEKDPGNRYQHMDDMVSELRRLRTHAADTARMQGPRRTAGVQRSAGRPADAAERPVYLWRRRQVILSAAAVIAVLATALLLVQKPRAPVTSMAVLPFINASGDPQAEYLSDGFTEGLINTLSKLPGLKMMSSRSVFRFKGQDIDPRKAAQDLNVGAVLTGRILQRGGDLSISAELIDAEDDTHLWGDQYSRKTSDLLAVQTAISREIAEKLKIAMTGDQQRNFEASPTRDPAAYQLFLKGLFFLNKRSREGFMQAGRYFHAAIDRDPSFARAHSGLAQTFILLATYFILPVNQGIDSARDAAQKALELDPSLGEAHVTLASINESLRDWPGAEREYRRSIELAPNFVTGHQWFGEFLGAMGRFDEGLVELRKAQDLDPLAPVTSTALGVNLVYARRYDEGRQQAGKALEIDSHFSRAHIVLMLADVAEKKFPQAVLQGERAVAESDSSVEYLAYLGLVYGLAGRKAEAGRLLALIQSRSRDQFVSPGLFVLASMGAAKTDKAFFWLRRGFEARDPIIEILKVDPSFDMLRGDPRFAEFLKKAGLAQ